MMHGHEPRHRPLALAVLLGGLLLQVGPASAQPGEVYKQPNDPGPTLPQPPSGGLSDQLKASDGVIAPPGQGDPGIEKPAPDVGRTPVIPAPGSPGGDPSIQPK